MRQKAGLLGLSAVCIFFLALLVFGNLNPDFDFLEEYVSQLGAKGEPYALWFNVISFFLVGILLTAFGLTYGKFIQDRLAGILLALFGIGFAFTSFPIDMANSTSSVSKAHIAAITLGLASWLLGLARISHKPALDRSIRIRANVAAVLLVCAMLGFAIGFWSMPFTHRLVFVVVFGWTAITAAGLLWNNDISPKVG